MNVTQWMKGLVWSKAGVVLVAAIAASGCASEIVEGERCSTPGERHCDGGRAVWCFQEGYTMRVPLFGGEVRKESDPVWRVDDCGAELCVEADNGDAFCSGFDEAPAGCEDSEVAGGVSARAFCDGSHIASCRSGHVIAYSSCDGGCVERGINDAVCTVASTKDERCEGVGSFCAGDEEAECVDGYLVEVRPCAFGPCTDADGNAGCPLGPR